MRKFLLGLGIAALVASQAAVASPTIIANAASLQVTPLLAQQSLSVVAANDSVKIDEGILQALRSGARPDVLVHFAGKADLAPAHRLPGGPARASVTMNSLRSHADSVQAPARAALQSMGRQPSSLNDGKGYMNLWLTNSMAIAQISQEEIEILSKTPGVRVIAQQQVFPPLPEIEEGAPPLSLFAPEASISQINAPDVWALGYEGTGITVANTDSGVRHTHQALVNQYRGNTGAGFNHDYNWFDPYSFSSAPRNSGSHGSHTMGTSVGDDGGANQIGVAPGADWIACIGFGGAGGGATDAGLIACSQFMVAPTDTDGDNPNPALHAHVANNSWGNTLCNGAYDTWYEAAVDGLIAAGIVPVFSMGNASNCGLPNNPPLGQNSSPSNYGKVFSVGSTGNSNGAYAGHSIKGPTTNPSAGLPALPDHGGFPNLKPNVVAPGVAIRSSITSSDTAYGNSNGTSMSAPAVAGMVALMWDAAPCLIGDYPNTGTLIMNTATPIPVATGSPSDGPGSIPNQATGWGEVDALAAVNAAIDYCVIAGGPDPVIMVTPAAVVATVNQDDTAVSQITVRNIAGGTLNWTITPTATVGSCASPTPVAWLSADPAAGSTAAGASTPVDVTIDATGLAFGPHEAVLCIDSNDSAGNALVEVPVSIEVQDPNNLPFPEPYCPLSVANDVEPISRVVFADIDNASSPAINGSPAHEDFLGVVGNIDSSIVYSLRVEGNTGGAFTNHIAAYFDWNRDGDLTDPGESYTIGTIASSTGADGINATADIAVPAGVTSGPVRMRVYKRYNTAPTGPCQELNWGQAEDYTVELVAGDPDIEVAPLALDFNLPLGAADSDDLSITNNGTGSLVWSIHSAEPPAGGNAPRTGAGSVGAAELGQVPITKQPRGISVMGGGCPAAPGQIVHDDGSVENGFSGDAATVSEVRLVDQFTPATYPAAIGEVCIAFISLGPTDLNYDLVVYDDDGTDGAPGTLLGAVPATATAIPDGSSLPAPTWYTVDLSSLALEVTDGSVYIGARYAPVVGGVFVSSDESATNPVGFAGGFFFTDVDGAWMPTESAFPEYRSLFVRAALLGPPPEGCQAPASIPWLSVGTTAGSAGEGETDLSEISVDTDGLTPGIYEAILCVDSNDADTPRVEVPVELVVTAASPDPVISVDPESLSETIATDQTTVQSLTITNFGGEDLDWTITEESALNGGSVLLYDQTANLGVDAVLSIYDLDDAPNWVVQTADDFVVPAGQTWEVDSVFADGMYNGLTNPATSINVFLYADAAGEPGTELFSYPGLAPATDAAGDLTIDLPTTATLPAGTYWVSVQPVMDYFVDGRWLWEGQSTQAGAEFHWRNPAGTYDPACTDWEPGVTTCGYPDPDVGFQIYGTSTGGGGVCTSPSDMPWLSLDPTAGTTATGASTEVEVTFDSTGMADGDYSGNLCIASDDPVTPLVVVPVSLTVDSTVPDPQIEVAPLSMDFSIPQGGTDSDDLSITNIGTGTLSWSIDTAVPAAAPLAPVVHPAPVHGTGTLSSGIGRLLQRTGDMVLVGDQQMSQTTNTTIVPANSVACDGGPNSLYRRFYFDEHPGVANPAQINSVDVAVQEVGVDQTLTVNLYTIPAATAVDTIPLGALTLIGTGSLPVTIANEGGVVNVTVEGLVADTAASDLVVEVAAPNPFYIGATNAGQTHPGFIVAPECGITVPTAIPSISPDFVDTHIIMVVNAGAGGPPPVGCENPSNIPWLDVGTASGDAAAGETDLSSITVDATGMAAGDYDALLCVNSNDADTPLVEVPVSLTVIQVDEPEIEVAPSAMDFTLIEGDADSDDLSISNVGTGTLDWTIDTAEVVAVDVSRPARAARTLPGSGNRASVAAAAPAVSRSVQLAVRGTEASVLVLSPDGEVSSAPPTDLVADLDGFPDVAATLYAGTMATLTAADLAPFDVVVLSNNNRWTDASADVVVGNALADYVDGGGKVVVFNFTYDFFGWQMGGRFITEDYGPFEIGTGESTTAATMNILEPTHPVFDGVTSLAEAAGSFRVISALTAGAELLASWSDGVPAVAANDDVVAINVLYSPGTWTGDLDLMARNAVVHLVNAGPSACEAPGAVAWLDVGTTAGSTAAGATDASTISVDSAGLAPGDYEAVLCVSSNDVDTPLVEVPVSLTVEELITEFPVIAVEPGDFSFALESGQVDSDTMEISNLADGVLVWDIETDTLLGDLRDHDPALDEELLIGDFVIDSAANGGAPFEISLDAGIASSGRVVGFSFEGSVTGITGNSSWASDMCMQVIGPDGATYNVGGFSAAIPGCAVNTWDFDGSGSTNDGTYASSHDGVFPFPPGADDAGEWTFVFTNGWDSASAATMSWTDVTITLHKALPPGPCDNPNAVSWLSVDPSSGTTGEGETSLVDVQVDATGLTSGVYEASLCVNSNDTAGNDVVVVPVELTVQAPQITVSPESIEATLNAGDDIVETLTIGNTGTGTLDWLVEEAPAVTLDPQAHFPRLQRWNLSGSNGTASALREPVDLAWLEKMALSNAGNASSMFGTDPVPAYTTTGFSRTDYVSLDALTPGALTSIVDPGPATVYATTFIGNDFSRQFFIATPGGALPADAYGYIDTATGAVSQLGVVTGAPAGVTWVSAKWDPVSGDVYALANTDLYIVDADTGAATLVGTVSGGGLPPDAIIISLAFSADGLLYAIDISSDALIAIDKTTAAASVIGPTGVAANFAQDMDFDRTTGVLYWAGYQGGGNSQIFTVDTTTGAATAIGAVQDGAELLSFSVAVGAGNCEAPGDVSWLSLSETAGSIAAGDAAVDIDVTLDATGLADGVHEASICVRSNDPERPLIEVPVELTVEPIVFTDSDLALSLLSVPGDAQAGDVVSLVATIDNLGPDAVTDLVLEFQLPAEFSFISGGLFEGTGDWECSAAGSVVTCEMDTGLLPVGADAAIISIDVQVASSAASGTVQTTATITGANNTDPDPGSNTDSVDTNITELPAAIFADGFED